MSSVSPSYRGRQGDILSWPLSKTPVAEVKPAAGGLLGSLQIVDLPVSKPNGSGVLPPLRKRKAREEDTFKAVHRADVALFGIPAASNSPDASGAAAGDEVVQPWKPVSNGPHPSFPGDEDEDIRALVRYATRLEANALEQSPDGDEKQQQGEGNSDDGFSFKAGDKRTSSSKGDLRSGRWEETSKRSRDVAVEYKALKERWQLYENEDDEGVYRNHLRVFGADADISGQAGRFNEDGKVLYGAKGNSSASASLLTWKHQGVEEGTVPAEAGVDIAVGKAGAKAAGEATINFKEGEATLNGELGAEAILVEIEGNGKITIIPARIADAACDHTWLGGWDWSKELCEAVETDTYDYGISLGGKAGGNVGVGGKAEGGIERKDGRFKASAKVKLGAGLGGSAGGDFEAGHFKRE